MPCDSAIALCAETGSRAAGNGDPAPVFDVNKLTEIRVTLLPGAEISVNSLDNLPYAQENPSSGRLNDKLKLLREADCCCRTGVRTCPYGRRTSRHSAQRIGGEIGRFHTHTGSPAGEDDRRPAGGEDRTSRLQKDGRLVPQILNAAGLSEKKIPDAEPAA